MNIYILTDKIRSGKTTALKNRYEASDHVGGFLSPDQDDIRYLYFFDKRKLMPFEVLDTSYDDEELLFVGPFRFLKKSFKEAENQCLLDMANAKKKLIIIDEIGKLELKDLGFSDLLKRLIADEIKYPEKDLLLVVRDSLLTEVIKKYQLEHAKIMAKDEFP